MNRYFLSLCLIALAALSPNAYSQNCAPPKIVANANTNNLFSPAQEMVFGDVIIESMSGDIRMVRDQDLEAYINQIGEKLVKHLPPTGLKFQFHVIDLSEANAFNIPGGHVFVSRKLISFVNNEDELAGVIAHELGHATVRHGAQDMSENFRKVLNITSLGDARDIREKFNLLIENARTKKLAQRGGHENDQQLEADRIGLFAMVAAGYDPSAFTSFFDRLTESEGKTGSWFSDLFGKTRPSQKRLREMIRVTEQLPQNCREGRTAQASNDFLKWQANIVSFRNKGRAEILPGLMWKKELATKLRTDASRIDFSPDGKHLLVQDDFSLTVLEREPLAVKFQIPVESVKDVYFTPDGNSIVFTDENLRFERWSLAEKKPTEVRELVLRSDCWEHKLSPDGNYLACIDVSTTVNLIETKTGKRVFEKRKFYELSPFEYFMWMILRGEDEDSTGFFRIEYSPDSRYLMLSRSEKFRFILRVDGMNYGSENTALALDLNTLKPVDIGSDIKKLSARAYAFLNSDTIIGAPTKNPEDSGIFSFPAGKRVQKFKFWARSIKRTANPDQLVIKPLGNTSIGLFDVKKGVPTVGINKEDVSMWNNIAAVEAAARSIMLRKMDYDEATKKTSGTDLGKIDIPVSAIGTPYTANVSDNFKWMILSAKSRGGIWNLETGERKIFMRGFRGSMVDETGVGIGDFPKFADTPHSIVLMNTPENSISSIRELPEKGARLYGRFILLRTPLNEKNEEDSESNLAKSVKFEIKDLMQDKIVWSRDFPETAPRFTFDEYSGRMIFYWRADSDSGKAELKKSPELQSKISGSKEGDYLIEVADAYQQKTLGRLFLETGKGSFYVRTGSSEKDWLMLYDSEGRVLIYSIKDGNLKHRFFGSNAVLNPNRNLVAVENFPGEINIYNLDTGESSAKFNFSGKAAFIRFNLEGSKMFVLTDNQTAYAFDINKMNTTISAK